MRINSEAHLKSPVRPSMDPRPHRLRRAHVGLLLAVALVAGCASRPAPKLPIEQLEAVGWHITERPCETPLRVERQRQPNAHDPKVMDEVIETHCPGWVATVYEARTTQPPKLLPVGVRMTGPHPALPAGLQVGASEAEVLKRLGPPTLRDPAALAYRLGPDRPDSDQLRFIVRQGKVTAIEWAWYID
ncbi:hypothetical protein [Azohydromonas caseinilytica]|uniref:Uncharacterized protein n=1 Tax=Azohydromonas caseinilytica TaxID=2728836 RepID=A0A848FFL0_9BURK|nr:hypothetical protein [Azohydromonas caseinilytica]NML17099.1 hypothetical protein [Azohydromonas caseinilytica]